MPSNATRAAPEDLILDEHASHRRATETAIWAMPLLNYKARSDSLRDVVNWGPADGLSNPTC
jgi:hypothetical protein